MSEESRDYERVAQVVRSVLGAPSETLHEADFEKLIALLTAVLVSARAHECQRWHAIREVVDGQVQEEVLCFTAQTAAEAYLQQELGKLHAAVRSVT